MSAEISTIKPTATALIQRALTDSEAPLSQSLSFQEAIEDRDALLAGELVLLAIRGEQERMEIEHTLRSEHA